jgi:hypothetical protein
VTKRDIKTLLAASQIVNEMNKYSSPWLSQIAGGLADIAASAITLERVMAKPKEQTVEKNMSDDMAAKMDDQIEGALCENERLLNEIDHLRKIAAKYELLAADGDRCAELVATAYDKWDTDIPWFRQLDCAVAEYQQGKKP